MDKPPEKPPQDNKTTTNTSVVSLALIIAVTAVVVLAVFNQSGGSLSGGDTKDNQRDYPVTEEVTGIEDNFKQFVDSDAEIVENKRTLLASGREIRDIRLSEPESYQALVDDYRNRIRQSSYDVTYASGTVSSFTGQNDQYEISISVEKIPTKDRGIISITAEETKQSTGSFFNE